jgi:tetratricopeptide (TPR) repeat protein
MKLSINKDEKESFSGRQATQTPSDRASGGFVNQQNISRQAPGTETGPGDKQEDKKENKALMKVIDWIVNVSIYVTVFFLPILFIPIVPSVLELNKQAFLVIVVGIGFLAWVGKMAWANEIRFKKDFILIPVIVLLAILALGTIFSNYTDQSFWGYFGGEGGAFISFLFFAAMFLLIFNNVRTKKQIFKVVFIFLISGIITCFYGLMQIWGSFILPSEITKDSFFNTVGSVYSLGVYAAALFLLSLSMFLDKGVKTFKIFLIILSFFFFFVLVVINFKIVWIALIIALALLLGAATVRGGMKNGQARILPMIFLVLALLIVLMNKPIIRKQMPVELLLNYKTSAKIMLSSWKSNPLLGVGLNNYGDVYKLNRPDNLGNFWSVNFDNATSSFFTLASTTGILGTLGFLFLVGMGVVYLFRSLMVATFQKKESNFMIIGVGAVWLFLTIILFTYFANMTIWMLWWLSFALFLSFTMFESDESDKAKKTFVATSQTPRSSFSVSFVFVLVIIGFIAAIYLQTQKYVAAVYFNQALTADAKGEDIQKITEKIQKAISTDNSRDVYYRNYSIATFALANQRVAEKGQELSPEDSNYISGMIKGSIDSADQAIKLAPHNSENYIRLAQVYEGVMFTMEKADERAIENYQKAVELDPKNPAIYKKVADIYVALSDMEVARQQQQAQANQQETDGELPEKSKEYLALAKENANKALAIKSDYADAHLLLASIYEREGDLDKAIEKEEENLALYPNEPGVYFRLGMLYYKKEVLNEAEKAFKGAIALDKNYANARYFLGFVLDKKNDKSAALEQFKIILENNQDNENLKKIVDNLENGREITAGLNQEQENQAPVQDQNQGGSTEGPSDISPEVENQDIPEEATPAIEEIDTAEEDKKEE